MQHPLPCLSYHLMTELTSHTRKSHEDLEVSSMLTKALLKLHIWIVLFTCSSTFAAAPVFVSTVEQKAFTHTIEAIGTLRANESVTLSSTVTDTVRAIHFEDGQRVEANDILVEMTDTEEHALLEEAQTEVAEAERQYQRVKSLMANKLATESLLDERRQAFESAKARLAATQSRLADRLIIAPFSGVVGLRNISVGTLVRPGDAITNLDDDANMKLDIPVPSTLLASISEGLNVVAKSSELGDVEFSGQIRSIDSRIDPVTRTVIARAIIPNPNRVLKPGMIMTVSLNSEPNPALLIPEESIVQEGFRTFVYVVQSDGDKDTVRKTEVQTGARARSEVVITQGLNEGEQVVTHGVMRLKNGAEINIKSENSEDQPLQERLTAKAPSAE